MLADTTQVRQTVKFTTQYYTTANFHRSYIAVEDKSTSLWNVVPNSGLEKKVAVARATSPSGTNKRQPSICCWQHLAMVDVVKCRRQWTVDRRLYLTHRWPTLYTTDWRAASGVAGNFCQGVQNKFVTTAHIRTVNHRILSRGYPLQSLPYQHFLIGFVRSSQKVSLVGARGSGPLDLPSLETLHVLRRLFSQAPLHPA